MMGVKSVIGLGGILPKGDVFAVVIFSKCEISREQAALFRLIALNIKIAALHFAQQIFEPAAKKTTLDFAAYNKILEL